MANAKAFIVAASSAVASWLLVRWVASRSTARRQLAHPVEQWENEGGAIRGGNPAATVKIDGS